MTAEIVLPTGTEYVPIEEIPSLIAQALIPDAAGEPRTVASFIKTARPGAKGKASEWNGWPIDDDDRGILEQIWAELPPIPDRATEDEVSPYMDAFRKKGLELDWELGICWRNPQLHAAVARRDAEREHLKAVIDAVRRGHLKAVSKHTRILVNEYTMNAVVLVNDLAAYVQRFQISVRFRAPTSDELGGIYLQQDEARRAAGRYSLEEAADEIARHTGERSDQVKKALVLAAEAGALPVYRPGENLKDRTANIREFYQETYAEDLNAWLQHSEPRIKWRFPCHDSKEPGSENISAVAATPDTRRPPKTLPWQEEKILGAIAELGYDPLRLPKRKGGGSDVKGLVNAKLVPSSMTDAAFNKAWMRLRAKGNRRVWEAD